MEDNNHNILSEESRNYVAQEIKDSGNRIAGILPSTIVGFGVTAVGSIGSMSGELGLFKILVFLIAFISVFIISGLYIGTNSYKIFRNSAFLAYFSKEQGDWERLLKKYRDYYGTGVMHIETTTLGLIYTILAGMISLFLGYMVGTLLYNINIPLPLLILIGTAIASSSILFLLLYYTVCKRLLKIESFINETKERVENLIID